MGAIEFPPYGQVARRYRESIKPDALAPAAWESHLPLAERERHFFIWRESVLSEINRVLWPQWDSSARNWVTADPRRMTLTNTDFDLFEIFKAVEMLHTTPDTPAAAASIPTHFQYFHDEDTGKIGERYFFYDTTLPAEHLARFASDVRNTLERTLGSVSLQFKLRLQRPRAYQVASLLGRTHHFEDARTSMTPSMCSGNCLEGCMLGAATYERWLDDGFRPTEIQTQSLARFAVDMGDRRVYAGVHYPSDNLCSWIIALSLAKRVFRRRETFNFLRDAIVKRSNVWNLIKSAKEEAYQDALALIEALTE